MSFGAIERTRAKGRPVNLFYVKYGSAPNSFYAYTDAEKPITNNGVTYQPLAISRGKIVVSGTLDKAFSKLHSYYDKSAKIKAKVVSAMAYPIFL